VRTVSSNRPTPAAEQSGNMDLLASQLLEKLRNANTKTVAVRFLHGAKVNDRSLGYELTDSFTAALVKSAGDIHILDRPHLVQVLEERKWMAIDFEEITATRCSSFWLTANVSLFMG
jgi:hypothetical protein